MPARSGSTTLSKAVSHCWRFIRVCSIRLRSRWPITSSILNAGRFLPSTWPGISIRAWQLLTPHSAIFLVTRTSFLVRAIFTEARINCSTTGFANPVTWMWRSDFLIHSYTKDITGSGATTAGVVIARNERMFIPKNDTVTATDLSGRTVAYRWNETLFWNVFYVKGAFLDADKAFEVITGSRTLDLRMLRKGISTTVLARFLASHPQISVKCNALDESENATIRKRVLRLGLTA